MACLRHKGKGLFSLAVDTVVQAPRPEASEASLVLLKLGLCDSEPLCNAVDLPAARLLSSIAAIL